MYHEDNIVAKINDLYKKKDWESIVNEFRDHPDRNKVLWVYPTAQNFKFIGASVKMLRCERILSVGCGSGLLEWMITEATGVPVSGTEVDGVWWQCKYAPPTYIPLIITPPALGDDTIRLLQESQNTALLFCYFNNRKAFNEYLKYFSGTTIIIIGPSDGKCVHTEPSPFEDFGFGWTLYDSQEVASTKDFIAIYNKK